MWRFVGCRVVLGRVEGVQLALALVEGTMTSWRRW